MRGRCRIASAATLLAAVVTLTCTSSAPAAYVDDVAQAWEDDPVYVDPDERAALSASEERELEQQIGEGDESVYVAILPEEARSEGGGTTVGVLRELAQEQGSSATYAAIIGGQFRAGSTDNIDAAGLAEDAFNDNRGDGVPAVLDAFVTSVQQAESGGSGAGGSSGGDGDGPGLIGLIFPLLFIVGGIALVSKMRRRRTTERAASAPAHIDDMEVDELQEVNRAARGDLVALGEALRTMDIEIQLPDAPEPAKQRYVTALDAYQKVSAVIDEADTLPELRPVSRDIARGRYALDCARALLDGKPEPEPRVACFFDPRHGTSVRDVQWIGPKNESLLVPACEICADRVEAGRQPDTRQVEVQGQKMPYYEEPQMGGYYGGFFGGGGGGGGSLITGMLLGNLLGGGGLFGGSGWSSGGGGDSGWGGGDWGGGGDFGGDFGGGGDF